MPDINPFKRLNSSMPLTDFDCGDSDLNEFLLADALRWQEKLLCVTYCLSIESRIAVYFSLSNDKIAASTLSKGDWRKIKAKFPHAKHRSDYPAVKIGRLAVHKYFHGSEIHWGSRTLDFIKQWMVTDNKTGCCFITVDAYPEAVRKRCRFI